MRVHTGDTIAAIATASGEGGIGIIRVSGDAAVPLVDAIIREKKAVGIDRRKSHSVFLASVVDPADGSLVDEALVTVMRAPNTYTREDVIEINCHGGVVALRKALGLVLAAGARAAEPGEFTKRAYLNGRIDLAQAEAVIDTIRSRTESALKAAVDQLEGGLSKRINGIAEALAAVLTQIEAAVDFSDEDIETLPAGQLLAMLGQARGELAALLATAVRGRMIKEGVRVAIVGRPNVGKSSLLNALLRRERAIVTPVPGTTRDVIEESVTISGVPLVLRDTAGIRETEDTVERIGVELSRRAIETAQLVLCVVDGSRELDEEDRRLVDDVAGETALLVVNKADLPRASSVDALELPAGFSARVELSALSGAGIEGLERAIEELFSSGEVEGSSTTLVTNARHEQLLASALGRIEEAARLVDAGGPEEVVALVLREALGDLGEVTGETVGEDVLGRIFDQFCIGK